MGSFSKKNAACACWPTVTVKFTAASVRLSTSRSRSTDTSFVFSGSAVHEVREGDIRRTCRRSTEGSSTLRQPRPPSVHTGRETLKQRHAPFVIYSDTWGAETGPWIVWMDGKQVQYLIRGGSWCPVNSPASLDLVKKCQSSTSEQSRRRSCRVEISQRNQETWNGDYSSANPLHTKSPCQTGNIQVRIQVLWNIWTSDIKKSQKKRKAPFCFLIARLKFSVKWSEIMK